MNAREAALERDRAARARLADRLALLDRPLRHGPIVDPGKQGGRRVPKPSRREIEILQRVADGETNHEIAASLFVSYETVKTHIKNAISKLDANNRTHAVAVALRRGFIT